MQFLYAGKKSTLSVGNVKAIGDMPEGTVICNVEEVSTSEVQHPQCIYLHFLIVYSCGIQMAVRLQPGNARDGDHVHTAFFLVFCFSWDCSISCLGDSSKCGNLSCGCSAWMCSFIKSDQTGILYT